MSRGARRRNKTVRQRPKDGVDRDHRRRDPDRNNSRRTFAPAPMEALLRRANEHPEEPGLQPLVARQLLALQGSHGNQYVQRLARSAMTSPGEDGTEHSPIREDARSAPLPASNGIAAQRKSNHLDAPPPLNQYPESVLFRAAPGRPTPKQKGKPGRAGKQTPELRVKFEFGVQKFDNMPFTEAAKLIRTYVTAERKACWRLTKDINKQWSNYLQASISEFLGGAKPPPDAMWQKALDRSYAAIFAYRSGDTKAAMKNLHRAKSDFNKAHAAWVQYKNGVSAGGEAAILNMKIAIAVLLAAATGGAGGLTVGATMKGAALAATVTAAGVTSQELTVENKVDVSNILEKTAATFTKSLLGGPLEKLFQTKLYGAVYGALPKELVGSYGPRLLEEFSKFLAGAATSWIEPHIKQTAASLRGKDFGREKFLNELVSGLKEDGITQAFQAFLAGKGG